MTGAHRRDDPRTVADLVADRDMAPVGAVDPHRPVVDGRDRSPKELRADVEELRVELGEAPAEPVRRADVPAPAGGGVRGRSVPALGVVVGLSLVAVLVGSRRRNRSKGTTV